MPEIHVTITSEAEVKVSAAGVCGAGCAQLTKEIEREIGTTTADAKKPEYFQTQQQAGQQATAGR